MLKFFLRLFLAFGLPFGLLMSSLDVLFGSGFNIGQILVISIGFGLMMSAILGGLHIERLRSLGATLPDDMGVRHKAIIDGDLDGDALIDRLRQDDTFGRLKITSTQGAIQLSKGASWMSWGELISIAIAGGENDAYQYTIESTPKVGWTLLDYGRNWQNVKQLTELLQKS